MFSHLSPPPPPPPADMGRKGGWWGEERGERERGKEGRRRDETLLWIYQCSLCISIVLLEFQSHTNVSLFSGVEYGEGGGVVIPPRVLGILG